MINLLPRLAMSAVAFLASCGTLTAADETTPAPPTADAGETSAPDGTEDRVLAERLAASLAEASERLREGEFDRGTIDLQTAAVRDIDALLDRVRSSASTASPDSAPESGTGARSSASESNRSGAPSSNRDAARSSEQAGEGNASAQDAELAHRRDLAQSVWGHLPPRVQEDLRRSFNEHFVPQYEDLIRRYYEALAERPRTPMSPD